MPSPFPGMAPYLEHPGLWPGVHLNLIATIQEVLGRALRPRYILRVEERVYISDESDPGRRVIVPDVQVVRPTENRGAWEQGSSVEVAEPIVMTTLVEDEIREPYLKVIDRESREVITVIEILSAANKIAGSRGRQSYESKRHDVMASPTHLVEIDLLRCGERLVTREGLPPCEYLVHVSRSVDRPKGWIWPIRLSQRLPAIRVPLASGDLDASLDLQDVVTSVYARANYDLDMDYRREAVPALEPKWSAWADQTLRDAGLR